MCKMLYAVAMQWGLIFSAVVFFASDPVLLVCTGMVDLGVALIFLRLLALSPVGKRVKKKLHVGRLPQYDRHPEIYALLLCLRHREDLQTPPKDVLRLIRNYCTYGQLYTVAKLLDWRGIDALNGRLLYNNGEMTFTANGKLVFRIRKDDWHLAIPDYGPFDISSATILLQRRGEVHDPEQWRIAANTADEQFRKLIRAWQALDAADVASYEERCAKQKDSW